MEKSYKPMVSIVVAAYNAAEFLEENIESLLSQTYTDFELIYVNDGSKDNTLEILQGYQKTDERVIILSQENQGAGAARNFGISKASGKYLLVLDADDYFDTRMLEIIVPLAEERRTDILIFDSWEINHQTRVITPKFDAIMNWAVPEQEVFSAGDVMDVIFKISSQYVWNKLYRMEFIVENKIQFQTIRITDDMYFEILSILCAKRISVCRERLVYYRINQLTNQMANSFMLAHQFYEAYEGIFPELKRRGLYDLCERSLLEQALYSLIYCLYLNHEFGNFKNVFCDIRDIYFPALGLYDAKEEQLKSKISYELIQKIKNMPLEEFLFSSAWVTHYFKEGYYPNKEMLSYIGRIVLYGAGAVGKNYYSHLLAMPDHQVIAWVDNNYSAYQKQGLYVQSPEILQDLEYDYVYIAIKKEHIKDEIVGSLLDLGVKEDRLIWYEPNLI